MGYALYATEDVPYNDDDCFSIRSVDNGSLCSEDKNSFISNDSNKIVTSFTDNTSDYDELCDYLLSIY